RSRGLPFAGCQAHRVHRAHTAATPGRAARTTRNAAGGLGCRCGATGAHGLRPGVRGTSAQAGDPAAHREPDRTAGARWHLRREGRGAGGLAGRQVRLRTYAAVGSGPALVQRAGCRSGRRDAVVRPVVLNPDLDALAPLGDTVAVGVAQRVHAAAVFLLVEILALADLDHALGSAALAPVVCPIEHAGITGRGTFPAVVDLLHVLPAGNSQGTRDGVVAVLVRIQGRALEPHVEADSTTQAAFRLVLQALHPLEPVVAIIIRIDELDTVRLRIADVLVLA